MNERPKTWAAATLEDICEVIQGQSPPGSSYNQIGNGLPFYQGKAEFGDLYPAPRKWCTAPTKVAEEGDVLLSIRAPVGPTNLCPSRSCIGRGLAAIRSRDGIPTKFVLYALRRMEPKLSEMGTGSTFKAISGDTIRSVILSISPLSEMHRIVAAIEEHLSRLDAAVAALKRVRAALPRYRAAVLKAACEGKLVNGNGSPTNEPIPSGWTLTSLAKLKTRSLYGPRFSSDLYSDEGPLVLRTTDITDGGKVNLETAPRIRIDRDDFERYRVLPGDLLFTRTGSLGTVALFDDNVEAIPGAYLIQYRIAAPIATARYVLRFFQSPDAQRMLLKKGAGVGRPNLNAPSIEAIPIPLPPLTEQEAILNEIDRRFSLADAAERVVEAGLAKAKRLRQAILNRAFEGKLVPQDSNDEPASALLERIKAERAATVETKPSGRGNAAQKMMLTSPTQAANFALDHQERL